MMVLRGGIGSGHPEPDALSDATDRAATGHPSEH